MCKDTTSVGHRLLADLGVRRSLYSAALYSPTLTVQSGISVSTFFALTNLARPSDKPLPSFRIPLFTCPEEPNYIPEATLELDTTGSHGDEYGVTKLAPVQLPIELIERVAEFLFGLKPFDQDFSGDIPLCCTKSEWGEVQGFMRASAELHHMGLVRWLRVITIKKASDWDFLYPYLHVIREVQCLDRTLLDRHSQSILSQIPHLYSASIDAHSDVWYDDNKRFAYRDVISALPPSLKRLEVKRGHGPDIKIIAAVKKHCPQLEVLRLGRCTMFNSVPACDFWNAFPHDHDAYMSDAGIDTYANSLGSELSPLKNLRSLRMGLYLVSSDTVLAHRLYHRRGRDAPYNIDWRTAIPLSELPANPFIEELGSVDLATTDELISTLHQLDTEPGEQFHCPQCVEATEGTTQRTEESASMILHKYVPSLTEVEWMGWLTPGHLGLHTLRLPLGCKERFDL